MEKSKKEDHIRTNKMKKKKYFICAGVLIVLAIVVFSVKTIWGNTSAKMTEGGNLNILKSDIKDTAKFYPYTIDGTKMEIVALKASDGSIRTAFNTCQVCFSSGRGYYKVEGKTLVCQNCGNVFPFDQVEKEKGGCNPVPILEENKKTDGDSITISQGYLKQAEQIFANWKTAE